MNKFFEKTQIRKMVLLYIAANVLNYAIGLGLKQIFHFSGSVGGEVARALLFAIIIVWFLFAFIKNDVRIGSEIKNLKKDVNIKECTAVIVFNYAVSIAMVLAVLLGVAKLLPPELMEGLTEAATVSTTFAGAVIGLITASILAPIAEELLFRGVVFTRIKNKRGVVAAIVISSMLFGFTHISFTMLRAAIFGACMCILFLRTKNILVPIVVHMVYNFLLTMVGSYEVLFGITPSAETSLVLNTTTTLIEIGVSVVVIVISAVYLSRKFKFFNLKPYKNTRQNKTKE